MFDVHLERIKLVGLMKPIALATALAVAQVPASIIATDWPRYRGNHFNGISQEKGWFGTWPGGQPKSLWKANVGTGFSSVAVAAGRVYTMGNAGKQDVVYCFDAATGRETWRHSYAQDLDPKYYEGGPGSTPTVDGDRVYTVGRHGAVFCLEAASGKVVWQANLHKQHGCEIPDWGFNGSAHIEGSLVIYNAGLHGIALNKATGEKVWASGKEASGYGTPVPFTHQGRTALAMFAAKGVVAIDPASGKTLWKHPWKTDYDVNAADPVISGHHMYVSSGYGTGGAMVDLSSGSPRQVWFNKDVRAQMAAPVIIDGRIYAIDGQGGDRNSHLRCLDLATGKVLWSSPDAATGNLTAADGKLIWLTGNGEVVIVEARADAYRELARAQVNGGKHWTAPVLANGRLYVRNSKGDLVCLDLKGGGSPG